MDSQPPEEKIPSRDALVKEIGWMQNELNLLQASCEAFSAAAGKGEVTAELAEDARHRHGIIRGRIRILSKQFRLFYVATRSRHNRVVEQRLADVKEEMIRSAKGAAK